MDGIRALARKDLDSSNSQHNFKPAADDFAAIQLSSVTYGTEFQELRPKERELCSFMLGNWPQNSQSPAEGGPILKLIFIPYENLGFMYIDRAVLVRLLDAINADPSVFNLIPNRMLGCNVCSHEEKSTTIFLATNFETVVCTIRQDEGRLVTKAVIFLETGSVADATKTFDKAAKLREQLEAFQKYCNTPLYLPFVISFNVLRYRELILYRRLLRVRRIESKTGHGSHGHHGGLKDGNDIMDYSRDLGGILNTISNTKRHIEIVESVWDMLATLSGTVLGLTNTDGGFQSEAEILSAVQFLRSQSLALKQHNTYLEDRARNQYSVLFALLTHEDSESNIQVAEASKDLAEAAKRDGSSMKTIAILTMAFLPATFFASIWSMPVLHWDEETVIGNRFWIYWAFTIPTTVVTFVLWIGITQREWLLKGIHRRREIRDAKEKDV